MTTVQSFLLIVTLLLISYCCTNLSIAIANAFLNIKKIKEKVLILGIFLVVSGVLIIMGIPYLWFSKLSRFIACLISSLFKQEEV